MNLNPTFPTGNADAQPCHLFLTLLRVSQMLMAIPLQLYPPLAHYPLRRRPLLLSPISHSLIIRQYPRAKTQIVICPQSAAPVGPIPVSRRLANLIPPWRESICAEIGCISSRKIRYVRLLAFPELSCPRAFSTSALYPAARKCRAPKCAAIVQITQDPTNGYDDRPFNPALVSP